MPMASSAVLSCGLVGEFSSSWQLNSVISDNQLRRTICCCSMNGETAVRSRDELSIDNVWSDDGAVKSVRCGTVSSDPSTPGKVWKYLETISELYPGQAQVQPKEPRRDKKPFRKPMGDIGAQSDPHATLGEGSSAPLRRRPNFVSARNIPEWMQQYQYSYSEVPNAPVLGFREIPWSPFGPKDLVARPWTGNPPRKPKKKKLPEFDDRNSSPAGKGSVKHVERPNLRACAEPKPTKSRDEILGEPLSALQITQIVKAVNKSPKQVNLGRDGLTHNMLEVIHTHWKRSLCCKIKCKGVPTMDLDNVVRAIEDKTGGAVIHRAGGVIYVFRGRNYVYKERPEIPLMLFKPTVPIYPRLIKPVPGGLTEQEARTLRAKGRKAAPLCKLSKNGVYINLVADVRAQLDVDEVVRVDCEGLYPSDLKKIGAKLKDLVPCILLCFENEQIIVCRGKPANVDIAEKSIVLDDEQVLAEKPIVLAEEHRLAEKPIILEEGQKLAEKPIVLEEEHILAENPIVRVEEQILAEKPILLDEEQILVEKAILQEEEQILAEKPILLEQEQVLAEKTVILEEEQILAEKPILGDKMLVESGQRIITTDRNVSVELNDGLFMTEEAVGHVTEQDFVLADVIQLTEGTRRGMTHMDGINEEEQIRTGNPLAAAKMLVENGQPIVTTGENVSVDLNNEVLITEEVAGDSNEQDLVLADVIQLTEGTTRRVTDMDDANELWQEAFQGGKALQLDNQITDLDCAFEKALQTSRSRGKLAAKTAIVKKRRKQQNKISKEVSHSSPFDDVSPPRGLGVDELAQLLAP